MKHSKVLENGMEMQAAASRENVKQTCELRFARISGQGTTRVFGVSMETMFKIAEALEVPVSKLFEE